jgi:isorenieratene synthase
VTRRWRPGQDPRAERLPAPSPSATAVADPAGRVVVVGGGIAGLAACAGLVERGVPVTLVEREATLGGRVRSWPVGDDLAMSRGFHAFFRQYYNLRSLLRRADPALERLVPIEDYPLQLADGPRDSFARIPRTPPLSIAAFVAQSPSFPLSALRRVDVGAALGLLDVDFPRTFSELDGVSAAEVLDRLHFPEEARHLALEVFARSFFADPREFSGGELLGMFHAYFTGSAEGLLFDVPDDDYDAALWRPLAAYLRSRGADLRTGTSVTAVEEAGPGPGRGLRVRLEGYAGPPESVDASAVVLATDRRTLQRLVADAGWLGAAGPVWRERVAGLRSAPPFAVWRLWLDRRPADGSPPFLGTSRFGPLDNVSFVDMFEEGAAAWAREHGGCVVELHAYALPEGVDAARVREELREQLHRVHPELRGAGVEHEEWLLRDDCPLAGTDPWADRPGVLTPDPRVVLAGDGVRCELPVALMERAATTGWQAANALLSRRGLPGHDLWSVPTRGRQLGAARALRSAVTRVAG